MERAFRLALVVAGALLLLLALGFFVRHPWATGLWPWPDGRLSFVFVASIAAAIAVPIIWIGATGERGASAAGAINPPALPGRAAGTPGEPDPLHGGARL